MTSLEEYAKEHEGEWTEKDRRICELEAQMWKTDYRNDPRWVIKQNKEHNQEILKKIARIQEEK